MKISKAPKMLQGSRKRPISADTDPPSKKLRKLSESVYAHEKHGNDGLNSLQAQEYVPHQSIGLMYRVALSTLCLLRISRHEQEYSTLTISFEDARFRNIVINYKYKESDDNNSLHVQVENDDIHNTDKFMSYSELFGKRTRSNLNQRFNSFFEFEISKSKDSANVEYLIIYSSLALNLADDERLKKLQCKKFYAFQFRKIDLEKNKVLKDFISSHEEGKEDAEGKFHRFSRDKASRKELLGRLKLNKPMQVLMRKKNVAPEFEMQVKKKFLNKLVIASEMPKRPELRAIIKEENEKTKLRKDYTSLQQRVLSDLSAPKKRKNAQHPIPGIIHAFNLLTFLLHTMFDHGSRFSIKIEGRSQNSSHDILLNDRKGFILIRPVLSKIINYRHFFPYKDKQKLEFSINDCFALFLQKLQTDMEFFIIFTNARLNFGENNELAKKPSGGSIPLKFKKIDVEKEEYGILKKCGFLKEDGLYRFSRKKVTREKILSLLEFPDFCEKKSCTEENKKEFLGKLIIAVDQANEKDLKKMVKNAMKRDNRLHELPYNYEELNEVTIRSLESTRSKVITKKTMEKILKDVKMNRLCARAFPHFPHFIISPMEILEAPEMLQVSRKRSGQTDTNPLPKKRRKHSESADAHEKSGDNELESLQAQKCVPHQSIGLMYRLTLSMLYSLRIDRFEDKYFPVKLATEDDQIDRFRDIVIRYKDNKSLHIQVEDVDTYNEDNFISFVELFGKSRSSSLNNRFNSFAKSIISDSVDPAKVKYLIIHSNSRLNLTDDGRFRGRWSKNFYPFEFRSVDLEKRPVLKDILCPDGGEKEDGGGNFYKFSRDEASREELLSRLQFNVPIQKLIASKNITPEFEMKMKKEFLKKLVIASGMPRREKLRIMIDEEIERQDSSSSYTSLQEEVLNAPRVPKNLKDTQNSIPGIIYELNLLTALLHTMFCNEALYSLGIEGRNQNSSSDIIVNYKNKVTIMRPVLSEEINYRHLFPPDKGQRSEFSINECFTLFLQKLKTDVKLRFFIIFTNASLNLGEDSLKFKKIDAGTKNYKMLRKCGFFEENELYEFSSEEVTRKKVLSLLECPDSLGKELCTEENKEMFLKKFIFAVGQADGRKFKDVMKNVIEKNAEVHKPPYDYEGLNEIAMRALESRRFGSISRKTMEEILEDVKLKRSSHQELKETDIEIIKFAKIITESRDGTSSHFHRFLKYLTEGSGKRYLECIKENKISLATVSGILDGSTSKASGAFKDLCDLWFDAAGNKTFYLENLEKNEINLRCFSSSTSGAGSHAAETFKALHDILFDSEGNETSYLKTLEREGMNLADMSALLNGTGRHSVETFKRLHTLWFGEHDKKSKYLEYLKREKIDLKNITSILHGAGVHSPEAFEALCDLWFDSDGRNTHYLRTLENSGIHLSQISSILSGAGVNAARVFKDLYNLWFTKRGKKRQFLKTLDKEGIKLSNICAILRSTGANVVRAFTDLYYLLFNAEGHRTKYLVILENEDIHFQVFATILSRAGKGARRAFMDLFNLWFDENGNKKVYLEVLKESGIPLSHVAGILSLAGANAAEAFKLLYDSWFDSEGQKTASLLHFLEEKNGNCFTTAQLRKILYASGVNGAKNFEILHDTFFNEDGSPTEILKDFYGAKFTPWDLTNMLRKKTHTIASTIKQSHHSLHACKEEERSRGDFCSGKKGPRLLEHFVKEDFSHKNLEKILQECDVSKAFKKFHDVCFDKKGKKTQILEDFYGSGFKPRYLTKILRKTGDDASEILSNFHASCFGEDRHLERFLSESELFTPKNLCKVLGKRGSKACSTFKKLRELCYKRGKRTKYLKKLIKDKSSDEIIGILCGEVGD